jgi:hypothetical protein
MEQARGPALASRSVPTRFRAVGEATIAAVGAVILFAAASVLKFQVLPGSILCPVPLVLLTVRHGIRVAGPAVALAGAVLAASGLLEPSAAGFLLGVGLPALVLGLGLRRNLRPEATVLLGAAALGAALMTGLALHAGGVRGLVPAGQELAGAVDGWLLEQQQFYEALGGQSELSGGSDVVAAVRAVAERGFPGAAAAAAILAAAAITALAMALAARTVGTAVPAFAWALPEPLVWVFIGAAATNLVPWGPWHRLGFNILLPVLVLYLLQGLSILGFFARRLEIPWAVRALGGLIVAFWPPLALLVAALTVAVGLCDVWVGFRRLDLPRSSGTAR